MHSLQKADLTGIIISCAMEVHTHLGPGLLESPYKQCLIFELAAKKLNYRQEVDVPLIYKNKKTDCSFRIDLLVEEEVIIEIKSVELLLPVHKAQLITYLRLCKKQVGLLINFNTSLLKNGIRRCVLGCKNDLF